MIDENKLIKDITGIITRHSSNGDDAVFINELISQIELSAYLDKEQASTESLNTEECLDLQKPSVMANIEKLEGELADSLVSTESSELLPCPFCGSESDIHDCGFDGVSVVCDNCACELPFFIERDAAIKSWNTRTPQQSSVMPEDTVSDWVSVEKRLPDGSEIVLICSDLSDANSIDIDYYWKDRWERREITHWMPLPTPPTK